MPTQREILDEEALMNQRARVAPGQPQPAPPAPPEGEDPELAAEREGQPEPPDDETAPEEVSENESPEQESGEHPATRPATPQEEKLFAQMAKQALAFLTTKEAGDFLLANAKSKGPEAALAEAVGEALAGIDQAALSAGVQITPEAKGAAAQTCLQALAALMAEGGMTDDPQALAGAAMDMLQGGNDGSAG